MDSPMTPEQMAEANKELMDAMKEARLAFNAAKKAGAGSVTVSRRTLYLMTVCAAITLGVPLHDVQTGQMIHDPRDGEKPHLN